MLQSSLHLPMTFQPVGVYREYQDYGDARLKVKRKNENLKKKHIFLCVSRNQMQHIEMRLHDYSGTKWEKVPAVFLVSFNEVSDLSNYL